MKISFQDMWKGHLLLFEHPSLPNYEDATGWRLLITFGTLVLLVIPALQSGFAFLDLSNQDWGRLLLVCTFLSAFLLMMRMYVKGDSRIIGLRYWRDWTSREKVYFLQTVPLILVLFIALFQQHFRQLIGNYGLVGFITFSVLTGLIWGVTQEFIYRGLLQTELVRRIGSIGGIVAANLIYTAGPLHINYFHFGSDTPVQWTMLTTIFGIGLLFGTIYHRSGNLWIPAVFHGLWPLNMT